MKFATVKEHQEAIKILKKIRREYESKDKFDTSRRKLISDTITLLKKRIDMLIWFESNSWNV